MCTVVLPCLRWQSETNMVEPTSQNLGHVNFLLPSSRISGNMFNKNLDNELDCKHRETSGTWEISMTCADCLINSFQKVNDVGS